MTSLPLVYVIIYLSLTWDIRGWIKYFYFHIQLLFHWGVRLLSRHRWFRCSFWNHWRLIVDRLIFIDWGRSLFFPTFLHSSFCLGLSSRGSCRAALILVLAWSNTFHFRLHWIWFFLFLSCTATSQIWFVDGRWFLLNTRRSADLAFSVIKLLLASRRLFLSQISIWLSVVVGGGAMAFTSDFSLLELLPHKLLHILLTHDFIAHKHLLW